MLNITRWLPPPGIEPGPLDLQSCAITTITSSPNLQQYIFTPKYTLICTFITSRILSTVADLFFFKYILQIIELQAVQELSHIKIQTRVTFKISIALVLETYRLIYNSEYTHILKLCNTFLVLRCKNQVQTRFGPRKRLLFLKL